MKTSGEPDRGGDQPTHSKNQASKSSGWMKHAGLGIELAGTTIGVAAIGYAIDAKMQNSTLFATALFGLVGFSFAMFRFIQNVTQENH